MIKSMRATASLLVIATLLLSACGGAATPPAASQPTAAPAAPTTAAQPTTAPAATTTAPAAEPTAAPTEAAQPTTAPAATGPVKATPGKALKMILLPKFLGIAVFDQAHNGAEEAAKELQNPEALNFTGPTAENSVAGQIEIVTNAKTQGVNAIMLSNNAGDQIAPVAKAAADAGIKVVTWDS